MRKGRDPQDTAIVLPPSLGASMHALLRDFCAKHLQRCNLPPGPLCVEAERHLDLLPRC